MSRLLQKIAFLAFTGSGGAATVLMLIAVATPQWIIIKELSIKNMHGISVRFNMITHSGLWWFCSRIAPEQGAIEDSQEECDTISYKDFRVQLQYENFLQPMVTFSLINNFKMGTPLYMVSLAFLIIANVMSLFQNSNRIFFPFINAILLIFSSLLLSMGCIYFIGAVDFEGLNDHLEEKYRPVSYEFGYCFKLVWLSFLLENLAIAVNVYLWMSYRSEDLKHQRENIASFKNIAMQMVPLGRGGRGTTASSVERGTRAPFAAAACTCTGGDVAGGPSAPTAGDPAASAVDQEVGPESSEAPQQAQPQSTQQQRLELAMQHWGFLKSPAKLSRLEQKRADSLARQVMVRATTSK